MEYKKNIYIFKQVIFTQRSLFYILISTILLFVA